MHIVTKKRFVTLRMGNRNIRALLTVLHSCQPKGEIFTKEIAERISELSGCSVIISNISRTVADLNRPRSKKNEKAIDEYRNTIREVLFHNGLISPSGTLLKPFIHIDLHGMRDRGIDIDIGTLRGKTCSPDVKTWFVNKTRTAFPNTALDKIFPGDSAKDVHRNGDRKSGYEGYGKNFNTFQIELSRTLRETAQEKITKVFAEIIYSFNNAF